MKWKTALASGSVGVLLVVSSIIGTTAARASTRAAASPQSGGTLTIAKSTDHPTGWDPITLRGVVQNSEAGQAFALYDVLFYQDPTTLKLIPRLGLSLTTADGGTTWVLKLRPNVKFSDGTPLDADAVKFTWARIADPANKAVAQSAAAGIATMDVVDPLTLKTTLKTPDAVFDRRVAEQLAYIGSPTAFRTMGAAAFNLKPVGAGPFLLQSWVRDSQYTFVRNPEYWQKGRPYLDQVIFKVITDEPSAYNSFKAGEVNAVYLYDPANVAQAKQEGTKPLSMSTTGGGWTFYMNVTKPPFNDLRVRQAVSLALNTKQFAQVRRNGDSHFVFDTLDLKGTPYYDKSIAIPKTDLSAAQKLIDAYVAENGGKPVTFELLAYNVAYIAQDTQVLQQQLQQLKNVQVSVTTIVSSDALARVVAGNFQAFTTTAGKWNDPALGMVTLFKTGGSANYSRYSNPTVDSALDQLQATTDQKTKTQLTHNIERTVLKDVPLTWFARSFSSTVVDKTVRNWQVYFDNFPLLDSVSVTKSK
jgi:peptide/nickel transport system substrate-binding protein